MWQLTLHIQIKDNSGKSLDRFTGSADALVRTERESANRIV